MVLNAGQGVTTSIDGDMLVCISDQKMAMASM
jgi:hypothetical protein